MENKVILCFIFLCILCQDVCFAYSQKNVSSNSQFSVITIGPMQKELYSAFGHSGIRHRDDSLGVNSFYNYGLFDFDQPNFYINFLNGKLLYMVGKFNYGSVERYYISENRFIKEQILNLSNSQKNDLYHYLENNIKNENKYYLYNYVYNNCATKIRDILENILGQNIIYNKESSDSSIRNLMDLYLDEQMWGDLGIDICLGSEIDIKSNNYSSMFLPDFLFNSFAEAKFSDGNELVLNTIEIDSNNVQSTRNLFSPLNVFLFLLIITLIITFREFKYELRYKFFDLLLFTITGLVGFLILYLWFFTDHLSSNNYNIIWATPLNFIIPFIINSTRFKKALHYYMLYYSSSLIVLLILWDLLPQEFNDSLIIIILILIIRSFALFIKNLKLK